MQTQDGAMTTLEADLRDVRAELDRRGWCQLDDVMGKAIKDWSVDEALPICVGLACSKVTGFSTNSLGNSKRFSALMEAIGAAASIRVEGPVMGIDIYKWNDAKGRTKEEVYAVLDKAIAVAGDAIRD